EGAVQEVTALLQAKSARRVLLGRGAFLDTLDLLDRLRPHRLDVIPVDTLAPEDARESFFGADIGISGVDYLIAGTGCAVILTPPHYPRSLSLLPPVHIAVVDRSQLLSDLFDLFERLEPHQLPSCLTVITGPSKTGDIELRLVTGVHGPREVH